MPVHIGSSDQVWAKDIPAEVKASYKEKYAESYPEGVDLTPNTETHDKIRSEILMRARESERWMGSKHPKWEKIDELLTSYIPLSQVEKQTKEKDERTPVSIVVPELLNTRETILTYMMAAFGTEPMFKYDGVGPEDVFGAILLEQLIELQIHKSKALLDFHSQWSDGFSYGVGILALGWEARYGKKIVNEDMGVWVGGEFIPIDTEQATEDVLLREGSTFSTIDPQRYLPDPSVEIYKVQDGEYVGWVDKTQYMSLLRDEADSDGSVFNVRYLRNNPTRSSIYSAVGAGRDTDMPTAERSVSFSDRTQPVDVIYMYIDLIPSEWKIGKSDVPEKWMFAVAGDQIVIAAHPMGLVHDKFPVVVCAPDVGGHELMPTSRLESIFGFQELINFLLNSHIYNIRKSLRNNLVVDPQTVNMRDVINQTGVIRTRPPVWGRGVQGAVEQLAVSDVTKGHLPDMAVVQGLSSVMSGAVDSLKGLQRTKGERVTATEFKETRGAALSRLQKTARLISLQTMDDVAEMLAYHTQQFMSEETYVKSAGRWEETLAREYGKVGPRIPVTPLDLDVGFDVITHDGSIEGGETVNSWLLLMKTAAGSQELMQALDIPRIFLHISRLLGARNAQDFLRKGVQVQTMGNEQVQSEVQAGNLQAVGGAT